MTSARRARLLRFGKELAPPVLLMTLFIVTGLRGIDFGHHWDEVEWQLDPVRRMVETGLLMPRAEIYPGLPRWLVLAPALPTGLAALVRDGQPRAVQAALAAELARSDYLLDARSLFLVVSALAILWLYLAARALRRPAWEATLAAAGLGLSWEYAYHARWLATDCIVVQFSALALYLLARYLRDKGRGWLRAAAVCAGLAMGSKYPGIVLLVPVLIASALTRPRFDLRAQLGRGALLIGLAAAAYLVTTPATLLEPFKFVERYRFITASYTRQNAGYGVGAGWDHLRVVASYFALSYFSPYRALAVTLFLGVWLGLFAWLRDDRATGAVIAAFPLAFLLFFGGRYRTAVVRNYLLIAPFLALFAARGVAELAARVKPLWARRAGAVALATGGLAQALFLIQAGESIRHVDPAAQARAALEYVRTHPDTTFHVSARVRSFAARLHVALPPNARQDGDELVFFAEAEGPSPFVIRSNDPFLTRAVFGPREVNFNWYSSWTGHDRVVVMTEAKARASKVALAE
jgi:dolichyl-phosphate-mannose-protein mannosyltransferase